MLAFESMLLSRSLAPLFICAMTSEQASGREIKSRKRIRKQLARDAKSFVILRQTQANRLSTCAPIKELYARLGRMKEGGGGEWKSLY